MQTIENLIAQLTSEAVNHLFAASLTAEQIQLQQTRKEFEGDITLVVFPITKLSKLGPEQTAQQLGEYFIKHQTDVAKFNVVKGFLNISMSRTWWLQFFESCVADENFGFAQPGSASHIMVEYSSPNTNKPLHLGHLRNNFLGYSVAEIMKAKGHRVTKVQIINDRGIHICKSMLAWQLFGNGEEPTVDFKGDKLVGKYYVQFDKQYKKEIAELMAGGMAEEEAKKEAGMMKQAQQMLQQWEAGDEAVMALWKKMNGWVYDGFSITYKNMGVDFDKLYYESNTYLLGKEEVLKGAEAGTFVREADSSITIDLTNEGLDKKVLLRKDGTAMYITQDIGTAIMRFREYPDLKALIYTVGNEQDYHFKVLFKILKRLGYEQATHCYHLSYGMVELPEGKMKSREGTVVDADDLMAEMKNVAAEVAAEQGKLEGLSEGEKQTLYRQVGMSALKYYLLRVDAKKNMLFNPKESIDFNGNTGPFIQYAYVRTQAVLRKAVEQGIQPRGFNTSAEVAAEIALMKKIYEWPAVLEDAASGYNPSSIAHYCYELAREYNGFYHDHPIMRETDENLRAMRITLTAKTGTVLCKAMHLLGVEMPDRM
ncbi:MAG: arginine--tRNA ligase [Flavobacteriales bacterium]